MTADEAREAIAVEMDHWRLWMIGTVAIKNNRTYLLTEEVILCGILALGSALMQRPQ